MIDTAQLETLTDYVNRDGAFAPTAQPSAAHVVPPPRTEGFYHRLSTDHVRAA